MISHKASAARSSPNHDVKGDCGHLGPMSLQNRCNFGGYELHPQKLVQLIGCRDQSVRNKQVRIAFPLERDGHQD